MRTLMSAPPTDRIGRYPKHSFNVQLRPFHAQPFMIAPVLPGETLQNMYFEARGVTDPIVNPIIGWRQEFFWFYVSMSSLLREDIKNMFIDPANGDLSATLGLAGDNNPLYTAKGGIPWVQWCFQRILNTHFRDEDEPAAVIGADGRAKVQIKQDLFLDSLTDKDDMPEGAAIASATDAGDLERLMNAFEYLRAMGLANMTYEDFLRSHGVSIREAAEDEPELLERMAEWQYPSNTVNAVTGIPASAVSFVFKQGTKGKPKFFKEPGFIMGIAVSRPKVYLGSLRGAAAAHMSRAWDWMPALLASMPETKLKMFAGGAGPLGDRATDPDAYWLDMCDVLTHGDQWLTAVTPNDAADKARVTASHSVPLPDSALNWRYVPDGVVDMFFVDASSNRVRFDGVTSLSVKGKQVDTTSGAVVV